MSEDYVNQLTLNFLISKTQLDKLNKKRHIEKQQTMKTERQIFREEIYKLFDDLFDENAPTDLLNDVKDAFEHFISKSIYYFKARKNDKEMEDEGIKEDINYDKECNYNDNEDNNEDDTNDDEDDINDDEDDTNDDEDDTNDEDNNILNKEPIIEEPKLVHEKHPNKYKLTEGSEDIHKLPLDWFTTIQQNYTMTQILPKKKNII